MIDGMPSDGQAQGHDDDGDTQTPDRDAASLHRPYHSEIDDPAGCQGYSKAGVVGFGVPLAAGPPVSWFTLRAHWRASRQWHPKDQDRDAESPWAHSKVTSPGT